MAGEERQARVELVAIWQVSLVPRPHPFRFAREGLVAFVDFLGPGSNIFPGMSGIESDWSEGQLLCNTNHIDRIMALKILRYDYRLVR